MKKMIAGSALALGTAFTAAAANAAPIDIHTGIANWEVNGAAAVIVDVADQPTGYWIDQTLVGDGNGQWVTNPGSQSSPYQAPGLYEYTLDLTTLEIGEGLYSIDGFFSSDNIVTEIAIGDLVIFSSALPDPSADPQQYKESVAFSWTGDLIGNEVLRFTVYNEFVNTPTNESGFLFAGQISAVPSPAAFGAGIAMLGGLVLRRRRMA